PPGRPSPPSRERPVPPGVARRVACPFWLRRGGPPPAGGPRRRRRTLARARASRRLSRSPVPTHSEELPGDDVQLDLGGAAVDRRRPRLEQIVRPAVRGQRRVRAEQVDRGREELLVDVRHEKLVHGGGAV